MRNRQGVAGFYGYGTVCRDDLETRTTVSPTTTPDNIDDYALMRKIADGDAAALKTLYDRHGCQVHALCLRMLKDAGDAEQLLTDVFFEIWTARERYDAMRASPLTYLMRLTRSRAIDRLRRKKAVGVGAVSLDTAAGIDVAVDGEPIAEQDERRGAMRRAIKVLDADQRAAIESAYYDGLSHSEIAEKLKKPLGTVKSNIRLGLMRLRDILSSAYEKGL